MNTVFNCVTNKGKLTGDSCFGCKIKAQECDLRILLQKKQQRDSMRCCNCNNVDTCEIVQAYQVDFCSYFELKEAQRNDE